MADEPNMYDKAVSELHRRRFGVQKQLHKQFAKTKPFRGEKLSRDEVFFYYEGLDEQGMMQLVQKHGEDAVNDFIRKQEEYRQERQ